MTPNLKVLDHGYVRFVESWGKGDAGVPEAGIIEAARQSTQGSFRDWHPYKICEKCNDWTPFNGVSAIDHPDCEHEWKEYPRGDEGLLRFLFNGKPQHATPFEFAGLTIEVQAPIFVFREWHRHRTQSYNEMSARYAPLPDLNYVPTVERVMLTSLKNKQAQAVPGSTPLTEEAAIDFIEALKQHYVACEEMYQFALQFGVPKEVARVGLPVGRYSRMRAQANLRNWLAFMTLRSHPDAQWEIQQFAHAVGTILEQEFPRTWLLFKERQA